MIEAIKKVFFKSKNSVIDNRNSNEIIMEIHDTFFTEVDRLSNIASKSKSLETDKQDLIDKRKRLVALGFTNTKEVKEANLELERLRELEAVNTNRASLLDAINYFSFNYPQYKFITEKSVLEICNKYGLVYGSIKDYIGSVPDKNLKHIEDFKIKEKDLCFFHFLNTKNISRKIDQYVDYKHIASGTQCPLEIVAPLKDFNLANRELRGFNVVQREIKDPIVLHPVFFNGKKYYLIVTAWGLEASDELVVNHRNN